MDTDQQPSSKRARLGDPFTELLDSTLTSIKNLRVVPDKLTPKTTQEAWKSLHFIRDGIVLGPYLAGNAEQEKAEKQRLRDAGKAREVEREREEGKVPSAATSAGEGGDGGNDLEVAVQAEQAEVEEIDALAEYLQPPGAASPNQVEINGTYRNVELYVAVPGWTKIITDLHNVPPIPKPDHMMIDPHEYQLKGTGQMLWSITEGKFGGFILADEMGLGKTLQAIMAMWLRKDEPGMSLVICPKSLCQNWVREIEGSFEADFAMKVKVLTDSRVTAAELLAGGHDVIIASYDFVWSNGKDLTDFEERLTKYRDDPTGVRKPKRPTSALHSELWRQLGLPFKMVVLDEAHKVNKTGLARHEAINGLYKKSIVLLSGTIAHNKWHNTSGLIDFLVNHPFDTHAKFVHALADFARGGTVDVPTKQSLRLLSRFMMAFTVGRPQSQITLPPSQMCWAWFTMSHGERIYIHREVDEYKKAVATSKSIDEKAGLAEGDSASTPFKHLALAQLYSIHPILIEDFDDQAEERLADYGDAENVDGDLEDFAANRTAQQKFRQKLQSRVDLIEDSSRLKAFLALRDRTRKHWPEEKMVVFSQSLRFLDIIEEGILRTTDSQVFPLRYDGSIPTTKRSEVEEQFEAADAKVPLLITAGAGGVGLNLQHASIVVIAEPWWNESIVRQAVCRALRQKQENEVKVFILAGHDSAVDREIIGTALQKSRVSGYLLEGLIRKMGEAPPFGNLQLVRA